MSSMRKRKESYVVKSSLCTFFTNDAVRVGFDYSKVCERFAHGGQRGLNIKKALE